MRSRSYQCGKLELVIDGRKFDGTSTDIIDTTPMHPGVDPPRGLLKLPLDVICLMLGERSPNKVTHFATALVLARSERGGVFYERVGVNTLLDVKCFEEAREMEVTIV